MVIEDVITLEHRIAGWMVAQEQLDLKQDLQTYDLEVSKVLDLDLLNQE